MKKLFGILAIAALIGAASALAEVNTSDIVKLANESDYALSITQKVEMNGEVNDGGWEQDPHDTYNEQYAVDGCRLRFIQIEAKVGDAKENLFSKSIPVHTAQMSFDITVKADKSVTYSEH